MDAIEIVAEPHRREILRLCWDGDRAAGDLAAHFDITFGAVSQHLKVLRDGGLVSVRRHGTHRYYRANRDELGSLAAYLESMWSDQLNRLSVLAESVDAQEGRSG
ncbi:MAG TPA: metalloregulator ArsR/SmtB family transcription factor [Jiangellaceae bacterium]